MTCGKALIVLLMYSIGTLAVSGPALATGAQAEADNAKRLIFSGALKTLQADELLNKGLRVDPAGQAPDANAKRIREAYALIKKADEVWAPTGDNPVEAKKMMLQGTEALLQSIEVLSQNTEKSGASTEENGKKALHFLMEGKRMLTEGQMLLKQIPDQSLLPH